MAAWLAGASILLGAVAIGLWAGSMRGARPRSEETRGGPGPSGWDSWWPSSPRAGGEASGTAATGPDADPEDVVDAEAGPADRPSRRQGGEAGEESALERRLERRMAAGMARARESVVALEYVAAEAPPGARRLATGVVIDAGGDVLSVRIDAPPAAPQAGVDGGLATIVARDVLGRRHAARWLAHDPESGLTLLRIGPGAVRPIQVAAEKPSLGNQVIVVGNPYGLRHSVSRGQVAGLDRALKLRSHEIGGLIQIQAPLYPGDSGAVVANSRGQWLGLVRSGLALTIPAGDRTGPGRDNDFGFAIAADDALWVAHQLRAGGRVDRAYLGVRLERDDVPPTKPAATSPRPPSEAKRDAALATATASHPEGAYLHRVLEGTPAAQAGLQAGDSIVSFDGRPIHTPRDLTDRLDRTLAGATIRLEVLRGGGPQPRRLALALQVGGRPGTPEPSPPVMAGGAPEGGSGPPATSVSTSKPGLTVVPTAAPAPPEPAAQPTPAPAAPPSPPRPAEAPKPGPAPPARTAREQDASQARGAPPAVSIPEPVRSPLRAAVPPPQAEELRLTLPRAVTERLEQLERRVEKLERQPPPAPARP
jgi:S1-C subfamily serine protease